MVDYFDNAIEIFQNDFKFSIEIRNNFIVNMPEGLVEDMQGMVIEEVEEMVRMG